jgi:hypothetical protein
MDNPRQGERAIEGATPRESKKKTNLFFLFFPGEKKRINPGSAFAPMFTGV